jgi:hypothetical protein
VAEGGLSIRIVAGSLEKVLKRLGFSLRFDPAGATREFFFYVVAVVAPGCTGGR